MKFLKYLMITTCILPFLSRAETLEEGIEILNQGQFKKAREIFKPLAEHGDANAAYWLAYTQFKTAETLYVGSNLLKAAEGGNPWAMATLAGTHMPKVTTSYCNYLGWPCDEKWVDKAIEGWERLAEEGDGKAMYALLYHDPSWWQYIPFYRDYRYEKLASKLYKNKGYTFFYDKNFWSSLNRRTRIDYLEKMAKNGDGIAMYKLYYIFKDDDLEKALYWLDRGVRERKYYALGVKGTIGIPDSKMSSKGHNIKETSKRAYFYCYASQVLYRGITECHVGTFFDSNLLRENDSYEYFDKVGGAK
ncbi:SEL1-like repeat protein, partial [Salinivibrio siamensis]|uniref:hypothetical protein n=1 Tax=Salinivibrio siamensis TaxID=414286 RepID=UPI001055B1B0